MKHKKIVIFILALIIILCFTIYFYFFNYTKDDLINKEKDVFTKEEKIKLYSYYVPNNRYYIVLIPSEKENENIKINYMNDDDEKKDYDINDFSNIETVYEDNSIIEKTEEIDENNKNNDLISNNEEKSISENENITIEEENKIIKDNMVINEEPKLTEESTFLVKNGFIDEDGSTFYYENGVKITGLKNINGINYYFSPIGKYLGTTKVKVIDVSYYQKDINWDEFLNDGNYYGVILRLGYYNTLDKKFERNIKELKRLNIPYGIYLFSYATTTNGAKIESEFTNQMISKYNIEPTLGIYYDIESWSTKNSNSNGISKTRYDEIIQLYINSVSNYVNYKYKVKVYSGRWYAMNRLGSISKKYVDWVAEYNSICKYDDTYSMWQYTSKGKVPGINGNVDISYLY